MRVPGQDQMENRHEVAFAAAETPVQIRRLAHLPLQRRADQTQRHVEAVRELLSNNVIGHGLLRTDDAVAQLQDEISTMDFIRQINQIFY